LISTTRHTSGRRFPAGGLSPNKRDIKIRRGTHLMHTSAGSHDWRSKQGVLGALALRKLREGFARDQLLEMRRFLMRLECLLVFEHFVKEKFRRFLFRLVNQECLNARLGLRLRSETPQYSGDRFRLLRFCFPECCYDEAVSQFHVIRHSSPRIA
jgi:hypothetical protein